MVKKWLDLREALKSIQYVLIITLFDISHSSTLLDIILGRLLWSPRLASQELSSIDLSLSLPAGVPVPSLESTLTFRSAVSTS